MRRSVGIFAIFMALCLSNCAQGQSMEAAASDLAKQIKSILAQKKINPPAVSVEEFVIRPEFSASSTLGFHEQLRQQLEVENVATSSEVTKLRGTVERNKFIYCICGRILLTDKGESISIGSRGAFDDNVQKVVDKVESNNQIAGVKEQVAVVVRNREDVLTLASPTYEADIGGLKPAERKTALEDEIEYALDDPEIYVNGSTVAAFKEGLFRIELLTKMPGDPVGHFSGRPRITATKDGQAFVHLKQGEEFAIRVINNAKFDVGAKILIDGLDSFSFSQVPAYRELKLYHIARLDGKSPDSAPPITGWHIDNSNVYAFNITTLPNSAAAELGQQFSGKVGVISVQFFPAWRIDQPPPTDEIAEARNSSGRGLAVGRGEVQQQEFHEVRRYFGKTIVATISIRYQHP